jgi:nicotinamidase-related amidase
MKALLVMDMVKEYIYGEKPLIPIEEREKLISNIRKLIDLAHEKGIPVIYVNSAFTEDEPIFKVIGYRPQAMKGTEGAQVIPELKPTEKDYNIEKRGYDGFWKTNLENLLKKMNVTDIYLVGEQTDCCIRETGVTAAHLGFNVFIIEDCCSTNREFGQEAAIRFMRTSVGKIVNSDDLKW